MQSLAKELLQLLFEPIVLCDSMSAIALASNPIHHKRTKCIEMDLHFVRYRVIEKIIELRYLPTQEQIVDILTEALGV